MKFYFTMKRYLCLCRAICRACDMAPFQLIILLFFQFAILLRLFLLVPFTVWCT